MEFGIESKLGDGACVRALDTGARAKGAERIFGGAELGGKPVFALRRQLVRYR